MKARPGPTETSHTAQMTNNLQPINSSYVTVFVARISAVWTKQRLTWLGYLWYGNVLLIRHEAQDWEDGKASHEAGATV